MKVTLSLEETCSQDVSIVVDTLRASTSITVALDTFKQVIPCFTPEQAKELAIKYDGILAGERKGSKIEGFDIGNSPTTLKSYKTEKDTLIITTSNGTRIIENMNSTVLVGTFTNSQAVAKVAVKLAKTHIDVVMAGHKHDFAIEDYLGAGDILYWIEKELENTKIKNNNKTNLSNKKSNKYEWHDTNGVSEFAKSAILSSRNVDSCENAIRNSRTGKRLIYLGSEKDVEFSMKRNISQNVAIYENGILKLYS